jgi:hypothetical protein
VPTDERDDLRRTAESFRRVLTPEHPDVETTLTSYADGILGAEEREAVEEHLAGCAICSEDVADLRSVRASLAANEASHAMPWWLIAAGIAGAAILGGIVHRQRPAPSPLPAPHQPVRSLAYGNPDWDALLRDARTGRRLTPPSSWKVLQASPDEVRGNIGTAVQGTFTPTGTIVESQRPLFTWPPSPDASYVVRVISGNSEIAHSDLLSDPTWTPSTPLSRGATYAWQVEVRNHRGTNVIPLPPHAPLLFSVLDSRTAADLAAARKQFPNDHLLLGLLLARAGLREEARAELTTWTASHPGDEVARRAVGELERW